MIDLSIQRLTENIAELLRQLEHADQLIEEQQSQIERLQQENAWLTFVIGLPISSTTAPDRTCPGAPE